MLRNEYSPIPAAKERRRKGAVAAVAGPLTALALVGAYKVGDHINSLPTVSESQEAAQVRQLSNGEAVPATKNIIVLDDGVTVRNNPGYGENNSSEIKKDNKAFTISSDERVVVRNPIINGGSYGFVMEGKNEKGDLTKRLVYVNADDLHKEANPKIHEYSENGQPSGATINVRLDEDGQLVDALDGMPTAVGSIVSPAEAEIVVRNYQNPLDAQHE